MIAENYITATCIIAQNAVFKNGRQFFAESTTGPADFFTALYRSLQIDYPRFYKMDNLSKLGWLAAEILLRNNFIPHEYQPEQVGIVIANANASLDTDIKYLQTVKEIASPSVFVYTLPNIMIGEICIRNHFKGETGFFIAEEFDAEFIQQYVNSLLDQNILQACICGWVELVGNEYKAALFLVEKKKSEILFTAGNMQEIFGAENN